jgi:hypothetical protein
MATERKEVWITIERPGLNVNSSRIICSRGDKLVDLVEAAVPKYPEATCGIDALYLLPTDAVGNKLALNMTVENLPAPLGEYAQPLRLVCDKPLPGVC